MRYGYHHWKFYCFILWPSILNFKLVGTYLHSVFQSMKQLLAASFLPHKAITFLMLTKPNNQTELNTEKKDSSECFISNLTTNLNLFCTILVQLYNVKTRIRITATTNLSQANKKIYYFITATIKLNKFIMSAIDLVTYSLTNY